MKPAPCILKESVNRSLPQAIELSVSPSRCQSGNPTENQSRVPIIRGSICQSVEGTNPQELVTTPQSESQETTKVSGKATPCAIIESWKGQNAGDWCLDEEVGAFGFWDFKIPKAFPPQLFERYPLTGEDSIYQIRQMYVGIYRPSEGGF